MKEYKFDKQLDGEPPQVSEYLTPIVTQAELHINLYTHRLMRSKAMCGCSGCKSSTFGLIDWLFYPSTLDTKTKQDLYSQLQDKARNNGKK